MNVLIPVGGIRDMAIQVIVRPPIKNSVDRSALRQQAQKLLQTEVKFIYCDEFKTISPGDARLEPMDVSLTREQTAGKSHSERYEPLACLSSALSDPLLSGDSEQHEFRRMNYFKFAANRLRSAINPQRPSKRNLTEIQRLLAAAAAVRDRIVRANLRLVVANAGKYGSAGYGFEDLFSDGVLSLMEAIEKFDYSRGFRFSTYATHCIRRSFYRRIERQQKDRRRFHPTAPEILHSTPDREASDDSQSSADLLLVGRLLHRFNNCLSERERRIIEGRFGLGERTRAHTLLELSGELGICKERVRQVEHLAIEKLRTLASELMRHPTELTEALSV